MRGWIQAVKGTVFISALAVSSATLAAAGSIVTTVTPLTPYTTSSTGEKTYTVTYSTDGSTGGATQTFYVGYLVSFKNTSKNKITNVSFRGTIKPLDPDEAAPYDSASTEGWTCNLQPPMANDNSVTVSCPLGSFSGGEQKGPFVVGFKSPVKDGVSATAADYVQFSGLVVQQEGYNGPNSWNNSLDSWAAPKVMLGTVTPYNVTTFVPKSGGTFFTGNGLPPTADDPTNTRVTVPAIAGFTTANLFETSLNSCGTDPTVFATCYSSRLTIPVPAGQPSQVFSPYLKIILQQDASTLKPIFGATTPVPDVQAVVIKYVDDSGAVTYLTKDSRCPSPETPDPIPGKPCLAEPPFSNVTSSRTPDVCGAQSVSLCTPQLQKLTGYFKWVILNTKNGRYDLL